MTALVAIDLRPPSRSLAVREEEFCAWVGQATPGQRLEYHRGHLASDRLSGLSPFSAKQRRELNAIANRALALAQAGRLLLVQKRHGDGDYGYFAVRAKGKPKGAAASHRRGGR